MNAVAHAKLTLQMLPLLKKYLTRLLHGPDCFTVSTLCTYTDLGSWRCFVMLLFSPCSHHCIIMKFSVVITIYRSDLYANGHGQRSKIKVTGENFLAVSGLFEFADQTRTETNFIQHKWIQLPYQVYMHLVKILTLYFWYIMKYRHARRHPHSVENPSIYSVEYIVLRVQVRFAHSLLRCGWLWVGVNLCILWDYSCLPYS